MTEGRVTSPRPKSLSAKPQNSKGVQYVELSQSRKTVLPKTETTRAKAKDQPSSMLDPSAKRKIIAQLVGKKCLVWCKMDKFKTQALWDTGAQVSIMSESWKSINLPDLKVHPISELLGDELLDLRAVNGSEIPFQGWVEVGLSLCDPKGNAAAENDVLVPFLVGCDIMQKPIIGFNAIEELIKRDPTESGDRVALIRSSLKVGAGKAEALLNLIHTGTSETVTYPVRTGRTAVIVASGQIHCISCPIKTDLRVKTENLF